MVLNIREGVIKGLGENPVKIRDALPTEILFTTEYLLTIPEDSVTLWSPTTIPNSEPLDRTAESRAAPCSLSAPCNHLSQGSCHQREAFSRQVTLIFLTV